MPNLLATRRGRLTAFFFLYLTEGIPLGFTATAVATYMRRLGLGPEEIGGFVASLYLPWAFKWVVGPIVDVIAPNRFGRRRAWIVGAQVLMILSLAAAIPVDFVAELGLFTTLIMVHNAFGATQDVAIDALACEVLDEKERGFANGLMFGGAYLGQAIGGAGVLFVCDALSESLGAAGALRASFGLVIAVLLCVTVFVAWPLREVPRPQAPAVGPALPRVMGELWSFVRQAVGSFFKSRGAAVGVLLALLPSGALGLSLAIGSNLAVEFGLGDDDIATVGLFSSVLAGGFCVLGGRLSDTVGRRAILTLSYLTMAGVTVGMAYIMWRHGWNMPLRKEELGKVAVPGALVTAYWVLTLAYSIPQGLAYGVKSAVFMDVTNPAVAATQFTAYMALSNLAISYSAKWMGWAAERWGYPQTLLVDAAIGTLCLLCLPFMMKPSVKAA